MKKQTRHDEAPRADHHHDDLADADRRVAEAFAAMQASRGPGPVVDMKLQEEYVAAKEARAANSVD